eukprot:gb/GFBE01016251.1/.p1 GENE.gb/GFBE01016251.1/~~gb/GFBE01016251.1/.p1  ORF type:complete len:458 (+),score=129.15 gb/GFBE01016251.1/:1-1374(+)
MNPALKRQFEAAAAVDNVVEKQKQARGREIGTVLDYDKAKGFGFLVDADKEKIFVHQSQIVSPGFRMLVANQKVSFLRGENRGKPWAEDVRMPDGSPVTQEKPEESSGMAKKRRQQLKEQWRNFFEIPQYAVKGYGESLPATVANQDAFVIGETVPQLGKVFVMAHGCTATVGKGNECATYMKEKLPKFITKAYEDKPDPAAALTAAFELAETEWMERAKMKSLTDGAEVTAALFVHALNSSGQPCVQLWVANCGASVVALCSHEGNAVRIMEPSTTKKAKAALEEAGFNVNEDGVKTEVAWAEVGQNRPTQYLRVPAARLIGGRPFKTNRSPVTGKAEVKKVKEWRCVAGEEPFLVVFSAEVASVLSDQDVVNVCLDAWGSSAEDWEGWEAASKAVVRTAQAQGPDRDSLACMAVQCWWQEKPLQRLLAKRADKKKSGVAAAAASKPVDDGFDMFG